MNIKNTVAKAKTAQLADGSVFKAMAAKYTPEELRAIAAGGRVLPGQDRIPIVHFGGKRIKVLFVTDTHCGSIFDCRQWIKQAFQQGRKDGCEIMVHAGDVCDGMDFGKGGHVMELHHIGYEKQKEYTCDIMSKWKKPAYFIAGNHDMFFWRQNGSLIVKEICTQIGKTYLGEEVGWFSLDGKANAQVFHGEDSSSYATSYRIQKLCEAYTGGEKPNVLLAGHTHKALYMMERFVHCVSGGALSKRSRWMEQKRLAHHSGFWELDITVKSTGVSRLGCEWFPFYA
jgi:predicted phosphodiesterase